jgi:amino acid transporter
MPANGGYREQLSPARPTFPLQPPHQNPPRGFLGRIFGDGLLAYTVYAFLFVAVFNSGENLLWIGNEVLVAISPDETPNKDLTRFIGIFCLMMICLIQLFSSRAGRVLNGFFALVKLMFLFILFCFGLQAAHNNQGDTEFTQNNGDVTSSEYISALLVVMYSFEGWENATFVRSLLF